MRTATPDEHIRYFQNIQARAGGRGRQTLIAA